MPTATKEAQRTTLYLDPDLHQAAKIAAVMDRTSLTALVERAVRELLERRGHQRKANARP